MALSATLLEETALQPLLMRFCLDVRRLASIHRKSTQPNDQQLLNQISAFVARKIPIAEWDGQLTGQFLAMCDAVLEAEHSTKSGLIDASAAEDARRTADIACSIAAAASLSVPMATRARLCRWWTRSRLANTWAHERAQCFVDEAVGILDILRLENEAVERHVKAAFVVQTARALRDGHEVLPDLVECSRTWCRELLMHADVAQLLTEPAGILGVELPPASPSPDEHVAVNGTQATPDDLLDAPEPFSDAEMSDARDTILLSLYALAGQPKSPLTAHNKSKVNALLPDAPIPIVTEAFYQVALDVWKGYWSTGDIELLALVREIARYLYTAHSDDSGAEYDRSNSLGLWICARCPEWLLTYDTEELSNEIRRLCLHLSCRLGELAIKETIIESFVGECRRREREGRAEARDALIAECGPDLRKVHRTFEFKLAATRSTPWTRRSRDDEMTAWEYLLEHGLTAPSAPSAKSNSPASRPEVGTILDNAEFRIVLRGGDLLAIYDYINTNRDNIEDALRLRLQVQLDPSQMMAPEGTISDPRGARRNQDDPDFTAARSTLARGEFRRAARLFKELSERLDSYVRNVACSYQAYAEAKDGDTLEARRLLNQVCESKFTYSSAYWNLACCRPASDMARQLDAIAQGLAVAPHPRLLDAAVYLGLFLRDDRLVQWLPCQTKAESLVLLYHLTFEESTDAEREHRLMPLGLYVRNGEPSVPNPTKPMLSTADVTKFISALLEGQQTEAIEFWLRCRHVTSSRRFDFWEVKSFYHEKMNQFGEAAAAFKEELSCRLNLLRLLLQKNDKRDVADIARVTRDRSQRWLIACMTADLRATGTSVYAMLRSFENHPQLFGKVQVLPASPRIIDYYQPMQDDGVPGTSESRAQAAKGTVMPARPLPVNLSEIITRVGVECQKRLHEAGGLAVVRPAIDDFIRALKSTGNTASASAIETLLHEWELYAKHSTEAEKVTAFERANAAFADAKAKLQTDLKEADFVLAYPIIGAFNRVNARLVRDLELLPDLVIEPVDGDVATIDRDAIRTALAIRVRTQPNDSSTVRLTAARAVLDDGTVFRVRDDLALLPVYVGPTVSAVLSFLIETPTDISEHNAVRIELTYELNGTEINAPSGVITMVHEGCPVLPEGSPYISFRAIEPEEIDEHFFGRESEQQKILESVSGGQQVIRYVEGIRRSGKSSLLKSIVHEVTANELPIVPVYWSVADARTIEHAGTILHNLFAAICREPALREAGIRPPDEMRCSVNPAEAYIQFEELLSTAFPDRRVLVMVDDFQELILAAAVRSQKPALTQGVMGILNLIRGNATPKARLLWLFAGQCAAGRYRDKDMLPGCLLWATWRPLRIDFLTRDAVQAIIREPLKSSAAIIPDETISRVHFLTSGHPEPVQQIAEIMLNAGRAERRRIFTPADADAAALELARESDDTFADTWFPTSELTEEQQGLVAALVGAVDVGERIELFKLDPNHQVTEDLSDAVDDLIARKILDDKEDGTVGIRAPVLDLWLHGNWLRRVHSSGAFNGNAAIFIDVANLTEGKGTSYVANLETVAGEGQPGRFSLATVLDRIEDYVRELTPAPVAARWASNYPRRCQAIMVCDNRDYHNVNVPEDMHRKGSDDIVLMLKVEEVAKSYRRLNHFVLVTGDKDFRELCMKLLTDGHFVHIISRAASLGRADTKYSYDTLARDYPKRFNVIRLESLLETKAE